MAGPQDRSAILDIIERQAERSGIPRDDFLRFAYIETGGRFNANAHNTDSGAKGLFQFMPSTAAEFRITGREFDPAVNTEAAAALYGRNRTQIVNRQAETGHPFLSGAEAPNGLDMYLAHQQGGGGYASIQRAIATGNFSRDDTRTNILSNVSGRDFERVTGQPFSALSGMDDRALATSFTQYWTAKYAAIEIADRGITATATLPGARERPAPLADGVLQRGERGQDVRALQEQLNQLGFRDGQGAQLETGSGIYGQRTMEALRGFQQANSIEVTGRADAATREAIDRQVALPVAERNRPREVEARTEGAGLTWPTPGNSRINEADKPREGRGEFGTPRSSGTPHRGVDIEGAVGDPVVAVAGGTVVVRPNNGAAGNTVHVRHDDGSLSKYFHLDGFNVQNGARVEAGQQIGTMGRSGNTPAQGDTHLHFELWRNGRPVDPLPALRGADRDAPREGATPREPTTSRPAADAPTTARGGGDAVLRAGATGAGVIALQEQMNRLGYKGADGQPLEVRSGVFGPNTDHALRTFQADRGLTVDGAYGRDSREAVTAATRAAASPAELLREGSRGADVTALQQRLNALGVRDAAGRPLGEDGMFGERTREAVVGLQRAQSIRVDGIVGPETTGKLDALVRNAPRPAEPATEAPESRSGGSFVERMFTAVRNGDGTAVRQVVDDYLSTARGTQFTQPVNQPEQSTPGRDPVDPSR